LKRHEDHFHGGKGREELEQIPNLDELGTDQKGEVIGNEGSPMRQTDKKRNSKLKEGGKEYHQWELIVMDREKFGKVCNRERMNSP